MALHKYRRKGQPSGSSLLECIPNDGCLLVFNAKHRNWRADAAGLGFLAVSKMCGTTLSRDDNTTTCDIMVYWREDDADV